MDTNENVAAKETENGPKKRNSHKKIIIGIILVAAIALLIGLGVYNSPTNRLSRQLDLGQKYIEEQNYEQAIIAFNQAIEIDPMSVESYLGLADAHVGVGDLESAVSVLECGYELTQDEEIDAKISHLRTVMMEARKEELDQIYRENFEQDGICEIYDEKMFTERQYLTDDAIKKVCEKWLSFFEEYNLYYPNDYVTLDYMARLYFSMGDYTKSQEIRQIQYDISGNEYVYPFAKTITDNDGESITYDEYGYILHTISYTDGENGYRYDSEYVYENGKMIEHIYTAYGDPFWTKKSFYDYDKEGRIIKIASESTFTYGTRSEDIVTFEYSEDGYIRHETYHEIWEEGNVETRDFYYEYKFINEFGQTELVRKW